MKTYSIVAALSLAAFAGSSFADGASDDYPQPNTSTKTRAEVKAELAQAVAAGELQIGEADWPRIKFVSTKTRAEVNAETLAAIASGELRWLNHEPYSARGNFIPERVKPVNVITAGVKQ